jgi:hypothetical protein
MTVDYHSTGAFAAAPNRRCIRLFAPKTAGCPPPLANRLASYGEISP